jgi:hypothetical protein
MCSIDGCEGKAIARGLCPKHYARQRRNGDPATVCKAGRPRSNSVASIEATFPEWSPRTRARYKRACLLLARTPQLREVIERATRPNGSINVSRLLEMATTAYVMNLSRDELDRLVEKIEEDEPSRASRLPEIR